MTIGYSLILWFCLSSTAQCWQIESSDLSAKSRSAEALALGERTATSGTTRSLFRREGSMSSPMARSHDVAPIAVEHSNEQAHVNLGNLMRTHNLTLRGGIVSINSRERERHIGDLHHEFMQAVRLATEIGAEKMVLRHSRPRLFGVFVDTREVSIGPELSELVAFLDNKHGKPDVEFALREADLNDRGRDSSLDNSDLTALRPGDPSERWTTHNGTVIMGGWNGRLGNRLIGLSAALVFAQYTGAAWLKISHNINHQDFSGYQRLFNFTAPKYIALPEKVDQSLQASCLPVMRKFWGAQIIYSSNWWFVSCRMAPARLVHDLMLKYVRPLMTPEMSACVHAPLAKHEQDMLTVTFRRPEPRASTDNPCSLLRQIQTEGKFKSLLVVNAGTARINGEEHPCLSYLGNYSTVPAERRQRVPFSTVQNSTVFADNKKKRKQTSTVLADACAVLRAKHLFVSWSTFPEALALLSEHLETYYHAGKYEPFHVQSVDYCTDTAGHLWWGELNSKPTRLVQYNRSNFDSLMHPKGKTMTWEEQKKLARTYPLDGNMSLLDNRVCGGVHR